MSATVIQLHGQRQAMDDDKPALSDGYTRTVNEVVEALAWFPLTSLEARMVRAVERKTFGFNKGKDRIADSQLAKAMRVSREKANTTKNSLIRKRVLVREGAGYGVLKINTNTAEWIQKEKATKPPQPSNVNRKTAHPDKKGTVYPNTEQVLCPNTEHTKDKRQTNSIPSEYSSEQSSGRSQNPEPEIPPQNQKPNAVVQSKSGRKWGEAIDLELAELMAATIDARLGQDAPANRNMLTWANDVRLMRERDNRPPEAIKALFAWTQQHHFWCANILSPAKLRTKWATLASQRNESRKGAGHGKGNAGNRADADAELSRQQTDLRYAIDNF